MSRPLVRYVPDWSGSMRQVAIYPNPPGDLNQPTPFQLASYIGNPYGVWPYSPVSGFPYQGNLGPGMPYTYGPVWPYGSGCGGPYGGGCGGPYGGGCGEPYAKGPSGLAFGNPGYYPPMAGGGGASPFGPPPSDGGFSCRGSSCGFKRYGNRLATRSIGGVPVRPSLEDDSLGGCEEAGIGYNNDWPLSG